jgi:hypothetical protein
MVADDGKMREQTLITLETLLMWMASISPNRVDELYCDRLRLYQKEAGRARRGYVGTRRGTERKADFSRRPAGSASTHDRVPSQARRKPWGALRVRRWGLGPSKARRARQSAS